MDHRMIPRYPEGNMSLRWIIEWFQCNLRPEVNMSYRSKNYHRIISRQPECKYDLEMHTK